MGCATSSAALADGLQPGAEQPTLSAKATTDGVGATPCAAQPLYALAQPCATDSQGCARQPEGGEAAEERACAAKPAHAALNSSTDDSAQESATVDDWDEMGFGECTRPPRQRKHSLVELAHKVTTAPPASTLRESTALRIDKCHGGMFINQYLVTKFLGRGACGKVFLCLNTYDLKLYAMKAVRKSDLSVAMPAPPGTWRSDPMEDILREISIMKTMQHPNIVSLFEIIDDPVGNKLLLVMEYMDGGPLLTREALDRRERVSECLARRCFRDMIKALDYLHEHQVVHGDLKPENVLLSTTGSVKLSDFGCSKVFASNEYLDRCNGTPAFLAPEMMKPNSRYRGRPTDVYALGACLYTLVFGRIPFSAPDVCTLFQVVQRDPVTFPQDVPISPALEHLLQAMLVKDPRKRITLAGLARHPWVSLNGRFPLKLVRELKPGETNEHHDELAEPGRTFEELNPQPDMLLTIAKLGTIEHTYKQGDTIMRQGDKGAYILYITRGSVDVLLKTSKPSSKATHTTAAEGTPEGVSRPSSVADMRQGLPPSVPAADRRSLEKQASRGSLLPPDNASTSSAGAHSFAGAASTASGAPSAPLHRGTQQRRSSSQTYSQEGHNSTSNMSTGTSVADPEAQQAEYDQKLTRACARAQEFVRELQAAAAASSGAQATSGDLLLAHRGPGCLVGEMAMFSKTGQRTASVRCTTAVTARVIFKDELQRFLDLNPVVKAQVREYVMRRQAECNVVDALVKLANVRDPAAAPGATAAAAATAAPLGTSLLSSPLPLPAAATGAGSALPVPLRPSPLSAASGSSRVS